MKNTNTNLLLFLFGCIGVRSLFVYIAKEINKKYLPILGYLALIPAIGFMIIYLTGIRETGLGAFGEKIWWNKLRPVHATLYALFAYNAIHKNRKSWIYLLIDVIIGLIAYFTVKF